MKTLELKLKKDVLIVDLPIDAKNVYISGDSVIFNTNKSCIIKSLNGNYEFLCKGSELTEEIASELVDKSIYTGLYAHYVDEIPVNTYCYNSAIESFISGVESKGFYWREKECDNQFCENGKVDVGYNTFLNCQVCEEADEKTFRNPLIFVKK
jgi:hypothetical protein